MRLSHQLSHVELQQIVETIQQLLYLEIGSHDESYWNPEKSWSGSDLCQELGLLLAQHDLVPLKRNRFIS